MVELLETAVFKNILSSRAGGPLPDHVTSPVRFWQLDDVSMNQLRRTRLIIQQVNLQKSIALPVKWICE